MRVELRSRSGTMSRSRKRQASSADDNCTAHPSQRSKPRILGTRSCEGCHQRKVRCDHGVPCTNCSRHSMVCRYPTRDSEPAQRPTSLRDIGKSLERLELLLSRLTETGGAATSTVDNGSKSSRGRDHGTFVPHSASRPRTNVHRIEAASRYRPDRSQGKSTWSLLLNDSDTESVLRESPIHPDAAAPSPDINTTAQPRTEKQPNVNVLPNRTSGFLEAYPDTKVALLLWHVYLKSVDPLLKILHIPTVQSIVVSTILDPTSACPSTMALTFAIYYAAVTALCYDGAKESVDLPESKMVMLKRYHTVLDGMLMKPDFICKPDFIGLQAFAIYITCLRAHERSPKVWILDGLAIRLAQSMGLHRNGDSKVTPFDKEMRLRLWWHLCVLDSRASEDQGCQTTVELTSQDLRLPLNVNDNQIYPDMQSLPAESQSWTEMSFFLIQTESCRVIHPVLDIQQHCNAETLIDIIEKRKSIQSPGQYLSAEHGISPSVAELTDVQRVAAQHVMTGCKKMEFVLQLREEVWLRKRNQSQNEGKTDSKSFELACDCLESSRALKENCPLRFRWLFNMYTQWYALAYVLRCLQLNPCSLEANHGWTLIEGLLPTGSHTQDAPEIIQAEHGHSEVWKYLWSLRNQAWSSRQHGQLSGVDEGLQLSSGGNQSSPQPSPSIAHQSDDATSAASGALSFSGWGHDFLTDLDPGVSPSLDLLMLEIPFLPDWNAILNGQ